MAIKKRQAQFIAPLQPSAFAAFRPWRIGQELVVKDLPFDGKSKMLSTNKGRFFLKLDRMPSASPSIFDEIDILIRMKEGVIRYGILVGGVVSAYIALLYSAGMEVFANWWYSALMYPVSIGLICYFTVQLRNKNQEDPFRFKQAFIVVLSMLMLATLVSTVWNILLFNVIDKTLAKELSVRILEETEETMEKWGAPQEAIKETMKEMRDLPEQFKPIAQLLGWLKGGLFMAIISLICASFIKRKEPQNPFINA